ncbi:sigma-54-dependent Fis family transcriptional regulator [candidate division KSB1 bacterium]|nr:sigma-54-dependent Fis family transcriptional regulator [candidate division KSB1 bacterium]
MVKKKAQILIIDDDKSLCQIVANTLEYEGYETEAVHDGKTALEKVNEKERDLILLDLRLPDMDGMDVLKKIMEGEHNLQAIMISGEGTIHTAVEATKIGAYDFLEKPLDSDRVLLTIKNALDRNTLVQEKQLLLQSVKEHYQMVGASGEMQKIHEIIRKAAATNSKVLIQGENGTGKELVARAIHNNSQRAGRPFIAVNCAAIPETLIESELFGHKKGAFTGAIADKPGRFQMAEGGTIFLDEIGDMSLMTQAKVLRTLEDSTVEMVGGSQPILVDVRVIAATNKDLQEEMKEDNFREDLYFRLNVLNIMVPALRDRKEDIPLLVVHYIEQICNEHGVKLKKMSSRAMNRLVNYPWPGNVRELKNFIEKMVILVESTEMQPGEIVSLLESHSKLKQPASDNLTLKEAKEIFERDFIRDKLITANHNITKAAEMLGLPRTYLHKKIKKLDVEV